MITGAIECASVDPNGVPFNAHTAGGSFSGDGRYVAFFSRPLVDGTPVYGVTVRDRQLGITRSLQVRSDGTPVPEPLVYFARYAISLDGRHVAFDSEAALVEGDTAVRDVFVHDRDADNDGVFDESGAINVVRVSVSTGGEPGNANSRMPHMSPDGRFVVFTSLATNLVAGDTNATDDVFLHDRDVDADGIFDEPGAVLTERLNVTSAGQQPSGPGGSTWASISADGCFAAYYSFNANLVPGDGNAALDVFLRDRLLGTTQRVSVAADGGDANGRATYPKISRSGRFIAYFSSASNSFPNDAVGQPGDVIIYDRLNRSSKLVSFTSENVQGQGLDPDPFQFFPSFYQASLEISEDGRMVMFPSGSADMCSPPFGFANIYLRDRGRTILPMSMARELSM